MKIQQQEKILSYKVKAKKKRVNYSNLWFKREEGIKDKSVKTIYNLLTFPVKKIKEFIKWLDYPAVDIRSMYALERSQSVKKWLKRPKLEIRLTYVTERRQALEKIRSKSRKSQPSSYTSDSLQPIKQCFNKPNQGHFPIHIFPLVQPKSQSHIKKEVQATENQEKG